MSLIKRDIVVLYPTLVHWVNPSEYQYSFVENKSCSFMTLYLRFDDNCVRLCKHNS